MAIACVLGVYLIVFTGAPLCVCIVFARRYHSKKVTDEVKSWGTTMELGLRQKAEERVLSSVISSMKETRSEKEMAAVLVGSIFPQDNPCSGKSYPALRRANHLVSSVQDLLFDSPELFYDAIGRNFETHKSTGKSVYERLPRWQVDDIRKDTLDKVDEELKQRSLAFKLQGLSTRTYDGVRGALFHDIDPLSGRHSKHEVHIS